jgi:hypothetical protein
MIKDIKKDLLELRGADVKIFGQDTTLPVRSDDDITVDVLDLVEALADYEVTYRKACDLLEVENVDDIEGLDYIIADNSYNWGGMGSNDFDYHVYETHNGEGVVLSVKFHRFGDVRGNYTENAYLLFDDIYIFDEIIGEQFHSFNVTASGLDFMCTTRIVDEYIRCSAKTDSGYIDLDVLGYDKNDLLEELVNEMEAIK